MLRQSVLVGVILGLPVLANAGIGPTKVELNLGPFPVDRYNTLNDDSTLTSCDPSLTIRQCITLFFNNNPAVTPYHPDNYVGQGVTGVRFFFTLGGGYNSAPFRSNGSIRPEWIANLEQFFGDLKRLGIQRVTPTAMLGAPWSGTSYQCEGCVGFTQRTVKSCGQTKALKFYPWLPFGFLDKPGAGDDGFPDGQDVNNAYKCATGNPGFWGWQRYFNLLDAVFSRAKLAGLTIADFDMENELNLLDFTVQARLIYDNTTRTDVLGNVRQLLAKHGFSSGAATFSVPIQRPSVPAFTCTSYFGDSALVMQTSELRAAVAGQYFGMPSGFNWTNALSCGGTRGTMIKLPMSYTQPRVTNMHTHMCVLKPDWSGCDPNTSAASTAKTVYDSVWNYLQRNQLTFNTVVFGETNSNQMCDGFSPTLTQQNVDGYRNSSLYTNKAAATVMRPWNNEADWSRCYQTPSRINPPYDPENP